MQESIVVGASDGTNSRISIYVEFGDSSGLQILSLYFISANLNVQSPAALFRAVPTSCMTLLLSLLLLKHKNPRPKNMRRYVRVY
jgi:hypothetical protein